jgi:hypothetical protein
VKNSPTHLTKPRLVAAVVAGLSWMVAVEWVGLSLHAEVVEAEESATRGELLVAAGGAMAFGLAALFVAERLSARRISASK